MDASVVIPLYNGEEWIEETIESIIAQTHGPREIIVVDDGSVDQSAYIADSYSEVTLIQNPGNGTGSARNFGFQHTSAPLVAFLDQDDLWHPSHLSTLTDVLADNGYPAVVARIDKFNASSTPEYDEQPDDRCQGNIQNTEEVQEFSPWERYPLNSIHTPSGVLIRRSALQQIGGWPSEFTISDMNAWFKLTTDRPMLRVSRVTAGKRVHRNSYLARLRTEKALSYLQDHIRSCEDALAFRRTVGPNRIRKYQHRLEVLKALSGVFQGALQNDVELLSNSIVFLEDNNMERKHEDDILWFVSWLLRYGFSESIDRQRTLLNGIVRGWPNTSCPHARTIVSEVLSGILISGWSFFHSLSQYPNRKESWKLFYDAMRARVAKSMNKFVRSRNNQI